VRAVVAGGAGFIGSHLCARLLADGLEVVALDNLLTGDRRNLVALQGRAGFTLIETDITRPLPDIDNVDLVFHLASPASPPGYMRYPIETALANSQGSHRLLELAERHRARYLMASTSEAYGDPLEHPQRESYWGNVDPVGERACYDESKRYAEMIAMVYHHTRDVDTRVVRIFNTYGPHSDPEDGRIIPQFVSQALRAEPITVHGDGSQTRSFCFVSDLIEGLMRAMLRGRTRGQVINLGNPDERSVLEIARIIARIADTGAPIIHVDQARVGDPRRRCPDIGRATALLEWEPRVGLEVGLRHTVDWFRERLAVPAPIGG